MFDEYPSLGYRDAETMDTRTLLQSEYQDIIMWAQRFKEMCTEAATGGVFAVMQRNKIFTILRLTAEKRKGLPSLEEYFSESCPECNGDGCETCKGKGYVMRRIGKYRGTITDLYAIEYVSALQEKIYDIQDPRIEPTEIE